MSEAELLDHQEGKPHRLSAALDARQESLLLIVLAAIQVTNILDFVIIMPLGPQFMRVFGVGPQEFGLIVSSYTFSAGFSGIIGSFYIDRFDRKTALLTLYAGFMMGTGMCALAPSYGFLVGARILAGAFGGVLASLILSIIGDVIPYGRRGAAMGIIMSSFSIASVAGVPLGLYIATQLGWHWTFTMLAVSSGIILAVASRIVPSIRGHIHDSVHRHPMDTLKLILINTNHLKAFAFMMMLMLAGFTIFPYVSPYMVYNVGLKESELTYIYLLGGFFTMFTSRLIGKLADKYGKQRVFRTVTLLSIIPVAVVTNLPRISVPLALVATTVFFILTAGRSVPALAMITAVVDPANRGSFMSFTSSIQQWSAGLGSFLAGLAMTTASDGSLENYGFVGVFASLAALVCVVLSRKLMKPGHRA
jgi:predicted MFS family arabinose efflux permease